MVKWTKLCLENAPQERQNQYRHWLQLRVNAVVTWAGWWNDASCVDPVYISKTTGCPFIPRLSSLVLTLICVCCREKKVLCFSLHWYAEEKRAMELTNAVYRVVPHALQGWEKKWYKGRDEAVKAIVFHLSSKDDPNENQDSNLGHISHFSMIKNFLV